MDPTGLDQRAINAASGVNRQLQRAVETYQQEAARIRERPRCRPDAAPHERQAAVRATESELGTLAQQTQEAVSRLQEEAEAILTPLTEAAGQGARSCLFRPEPTETNAALLRELRVQAAWNRWQGALSAAAEARGAGTVDGDRVPSVASPGAVLALAGAVLSEALAAGDEDGAEAILREVPHLIRGRFGPQEAAEAAASLRGVFVKLRPDAAKKLAAFEAVQEGARRLRSNFRMVSSTLQNGGDEITLHPWEGGAPTRIELGTAVRERSLQEMLRQF